MGLLSYGIEGKHYVINEDGCADYPEGMTAENEPYGGFAGSPLKYSFSEARHHKSAPLITLGAPGSLSLELLPLQPLHDLREVRGPLQVLLDPANVADPDDYMHVTLTDEEELLDAVGRVRAVYPNLMKLDFDNRRTRAAGGQTAAAEVERKSVPQLFDEFFELMNGGGMSDSQRELFAAALRASGGDEP